VFSDFSVNPLNEAAWLCYINGLEIPVVGVSAHFGVWQMPTLTLTLVPHPMLQRIGHEDRLQVAIFFLDTFWDPDDPQFRLLYEYEVVGWAYVSTARGRSLQLSCVAHDQILEQLHFFYVSSLNDIVEGASAQVSTDPSAMAVTKVLYPASLFLEGFGMDPKTLKDLENTTATTTLTPAGQAAKAYSDNTIGGSLGLDILSSVGVVDSSKFAQTVVTTENKSLKDYEEGDFIKRPIDFVLNIFRTILAPYKPGATTAADGYLPEAAASCPGKNFFLRWLKMTGYHKRWVALPYFEQTPVAGSKWKMAPGCFPLVRSVQDTNILPTLSQTIGQSVGFSGSAWDLIKQVFSYMYEEVAFIPSPPAVTMKKGMGDIVSHARQAGADLEPAIAAHCVKPQCIFALPPVCNIIFPSMLKQYTVNESYITQPTRVYLGDEFIGKILDPQNAEMATLMKKMMVTGYPAPVRQRIVDLQSTPEKNNKNFLLFPEELFKGPVSAQFSSPPWMHMIGEQLKGTGTDAEPPAGASVLGTIFDKYAEYEFCRARYAERSGAASCVFNPFVIPGFPVAIFDQHYSGFNSLGYANTVDHNWSSDGSSAAMDTEIGVTFIRTMSEAFAILGDTTSGSVALDIGPTEIIPEIAAVFQLLVPAHDFYAKLLFKNQRMTKPAVFDWRSMLKFIRYDGVELDAKTDTAKFTGDMAAVPNAKYEPIFQSYGNAMQFVARPGCTLKEYVEIWHGKKIEELKEAGTVKGEYRSFYSPVKDKRNTGGAIFWARIYKLVQGPGTTPDAKATNMKSAADAYAPADGGWGMVGMPTGFPQTRLDWDKILEEYRKLIRGEEGKIAPQS